MGSITEIKTQLFDILAKHEGLKAAHKELTEQVVEKDRQLIEKDRQLIEKDRQLIEKDQHIDSLFNSWSWKVTAPLRTFVNIFQKTMHHSRSPKHFKGFHILSDRTQSKVLKEILDKNMNIVKGIIIHPPTVDWDIPCFQRPQQLALELSRQGYLFFYCTNNHTDNVDGFQELGKNLFLTNQYDLLMNTIHNAWFLLCSTHYTITIDDIRRLKHQGFKIIYDYIDDIHTDISGGDVNHLIERHNRLDNDLIDAVLTVATIQYEEMLKKFPEEKVLLAPNGVDYEHFHVLKDINKAPEDLKGTLAEGKPIIGYYGSLAKWIDYELLNFIAQKKPDWNIILIGLDYDSSMNALIKAKNIKFLGAKKYANLPQFGIWFDVAIIPFKEGSIARGTSPIKLYEYMAMNKPVVVTRDLVECHKYKGILVANDKEEFIEKLEEALILKDDSKYKTLMDKQAKENTWSARATEIDLCLSTLKTLSTIAKLEYKNVKKLLSMEHSYFKLALIKHLSAVPVDHPMRDIYFEFALSTVDRGEAVAKTINKHKKIKGTKYLDIGCAYGGFAIALSLSGASKVVGVDIDGQLVNLAHELLKDFDCPVQPELLVSDILQMKRDSMEHFDIITCNDVIEHVASPDILVEKISSLLNDDGILYMEIPNAFNSTMVKSDGHYGLFGISLLGTEDAKTYYDHNYKKQDYSVGEYLNIDSYCKLFRSHGLEPTLLNNIPNNENELKRISSFIYSLSEDYKTVIQKVPEDLKDKVQTALNEYINKFSSSYEQLLANSGNERTDIAKNLYRYYGIDYWQFLLRKK